MISLNETTKELLRGVNFLNRYEKLVSDHNHKNFLSDIDIEKVKQIIQNEGFKNISYNKREKFFTLEEIEGVVDLCFKISVDHSAVEFILSFGTIDKTYSCGGNFGFINMLLGSDKGYKKPTFSSYTELEEILKVGFDIYKDVKAEFLKRTTI